jgi:hypothetical protein
MSAQGREGPIISGRAPSKKRGKASNQSAVGAMKTLPNGRNGRRTTLRVPRTLEAEIARTAKELDISENEALIRLAQLGAVTTKRQRDVRKVVRRRQAAVTGVGAEVAQGVLPSPKEMQAAILVDRD